MPAPSTAAGQTSAAPSPTAPALGAAPLGGPRGRRRAPVPSPSPFSSPASGAEPEEGAVGEGAAEQAGDVVRWAVFCCVLVPVVLIVYGTSLGGAGGAALGLVSVTAACRLLLRRSERGLRAEAARPGRRN